MINRKDLFQKLTSGIYVPPYLHFAGGYPCCCTDPDPDPNPPILPACLICTGDTPTYVWIRFAGVIGRVAPPAFDACDPGNCGDWNNIWWKLLHCSGSSCEYRARSGCLVITAACPEDFEQPFPAGCVGAGDLDLSGWALNMFFFHTFGLLQAQLRINQILFDKTSGNCFTSRFGQFDGAIGTNDCMDFDPVFLSAASFDATFACDFSPATCEIRTSPP